MSSISVSQPLRSSSSSRFNRSTGVAGGLLCWRVVLITKPHNACWHLSSMWLWFQRIHAERLQINFIALQSCTKSLLGTLRGHHTKIFMRHGLWEVVNLLIQRMSGYSKSDLQTTGFCWIHDMRYRNSINLLFEVSLSQSQYSIEQFHKWPPGHFSQTIQTLA